MVLNAGGGRMRNSLGHAAGLAAGSVRARAVPLGFRVELVAAVAVPMLMVTSCGSDVRVVERNEPGPGVDGLPGDSSTTSPSSGSAGAAQDAGHDGGAVSSLAASSSGGAGAGGYAGASASSNSSSAASGDSGGAGSACPPVPTSKFAVTDCCSGVPCHGTCLVDESGENACSCFGIEGGCSNESVCCKFGGACVLPENCDGV